MKYWLFKSEPGCFSLEDLQNAPNQTTSWDGVRNYQARNFMRAMKKGDRGFFYHSGDPTEIAGLVEVVREAYPDHTAWDPENEHFDPKSLQEKPRWDMVDVRLIQVFTPPLPRSLLREEPELAGMELMKKGSRLSVQPVESTAFAHIMSLVKECANGPKPCVCAQSV